MIWLWTWLWHAFKYCINFDYEPDYDAFLIFNYKPDYEPDYGAFIFKPKKIDIYSTFSSTLSYDLKNSAFLITQFTNAIMWLINTNKKAIFFTY